MAYLCINKDGKEMMCQSEPTRWGKFIEESDEDFGILNEEDGKYYETTVADEDTIDELPKEELTYWFDYANMDQEELVDFGIEIPKGSIEKLLGRKLTWEDAPVKL